MWPRHGMQRHLLGQIYPEGGASRGRWQQPILRSLDEGGNRHATTIVPQRGLSLSFTVHPVMIAQLFFNTIYVM